MADYDSWKPQEPIYKFDKTSVDLITNGQERVVRKEVRLSNDNKSYAKHQLKLMQELSSPYVVRYLHSREEQEKLTVYMPYYENRDLQTFLTSHELDFKTKMRMFIDILSGMLALHSRHIIHRDIKLKNIFVDGLQRCVVGDLGISTKSVDSARSRVCTPEVAAPEVYAERSYNEKVDIWALGIIAYQLFNKKRNGSIAFPFGSPQQLRLRIISMGEHVDYDSYLELTKSIEPLDEELPPSIKEMISGMLQGDDRKRLSWIDFYKHYYLQEFDEEMRLCTFMAEYKMIEDTKETLKDYVSFFQELQSQYFYKLQRILSIANIDYYKQMHPQMRDNLLDIHIIHYKLMKKAIDRYDYIKGKRIDKFIMDWRGFIKEIRNETHDIEHRINFKLRSVKEAEIKSNKKYMENQYYHQKMKIVERVLRIVNEGNKLNH